MMHFDQLSSVPHLNMDHGERICKRANNIQPNKDNLLKDSFSLNHEESVRHQEITYLFSKGMQRQKSATILCMIPT